VPSRSDRRTTRTPTPPGAVAEKILASFTSCPIPEVARLGRTLKQWRTEFLGYFDANGASNGGSEAITGIIDPTAASPVASGTRDNYRLRMLLIGGGLDPKSHTHR
jgi:transposase